MGTIYRFLPFVDNGRCTGFRLARAGISRPTPELYALAASIDAERLRQSARERNEKYMGQFRNHVTFCPDLVERMKASPRAKLYERVRRRLPKSAEPKAYPRDGAPGGLAPD